MTKKTHILWNPNRNYLGNWDLPREKDLVLTIDFMAWEAVENYNKPIRQGKKIVGYETDEKRIIHFKDKDIKPMICNEENAEHLLSATGIEYIEDFAGKNSQIGLYIVRRKYFGEFRDVVRIREKKPEVKVLPTLTRDHEKYQILVEKVKGGEIKAEDLSTWFVVPDDIQKEFNNLITK